MSKATEQSQGKPEQHKKEPVAKGKIRLRIKQLHGTMVKYFHEYGDQS